MSDKELTKALHEVHAELDDAESVSDEDRLLMRELIHDIRRTLGDDDDEDLGVGERLGEAVEQFSQSHPTVAFGLQRIVDMLTRMGI